MLFEGIARRALGYAGETWGSAPVEGTGRRLRIGLALGGGAARGWSHIGVLQVLDEAGIRPDIIAGCSIGSVVGGCYAAGKLKELETFARSLTKRRIMGLLDFHMSGSGLIAGDKLRRLLAMDLGDRSVEELPLRFGCVATELTTGHEIWLTRGRLVDAMNASYALPGVFDPVRIGGRWLMDGALVNPVPVTVARALGADLVICVNLNADAKVRGTVLQHEPDGDAAPDPKGMPEAAPEAARAWSLFGGAARKAPRETGAPGIAAVMIDAFNIIQDRISRSRLAGDPPDLMIGPRLQTIGLFEFHRAEEAIARGREAAERVIGDIRELVGAAAQAVPEERHAVAI